MTTHFDQPVILQQSPTRSHAIALGIISATTLAVVWACVSKIEEAIPAIGKLQPQGAVKEVQAPLGGVVQEIYVKDGQQVKKGEQLVRLDSTTAQAQVVSLQKIRTALIAENQFYRSLLSGSATNPNTIPSKISPELLTLSRSRAALTAENQIYQAQLQGQSGAANLTTEQQIRLQTRQTESNTRLATAQLEVDQLRQQLAQVKVQLANARNLLSVNEGILRDLQTLATEGGISRLQYLKQQQDVETRKTEVQKLQQEQERLQLAITQAIEKLHNSAAVSQEDMMAKLTSNNQQIAAIDSQLTKAMLDNQKQIDEIDSKLSQAQQTLKYQVITSPANGTVFELKPSSPGYVVNSNVPMLKVVPSDSLVAEVYITNKDIGFIKEGMDVDVRIDSFPFSEYGDIKGKLIWIGSDALPPDQIHPFYRFPAKVQLDRQNLKVDQREIPLQSGMSVSTNIKLRQRTVMSIFTDLFAQKTETLKFIR
ncbi:HlyD family efflux transporter periplasmic adaptor subunit [Pantanalinema sp. GBBB05]|uniref:HlyD family efflux transporter periplasmic adaptor subunit n=1 Tax=Pantanalinema sp. GBBB05 TaxID=2604139 RepID=UPI001DAD9053|nr:HlyD family efflux transporter periplasmic adaptor subunit [Pantanalinema sp. GBBB05]